MPRVLRAPALAGALLLALAAWPAAAGAGPSFPWTSFRAIDAEQPMRAVSLCNRNDNRTRVLDMVIVRPPGFYRFWATLHGSAWLAIRYDGDARPDWVWHGQWARDTLSVTSASSYDPVTHRSACEILFGAPR